MDLVAQREQNRHRHRAGDGNAQLTGDGHGPQQEGQQTCHHRGDAHVVFGARFQPMERSERCGIGNEHKADQPAADLLPKHASDTTKQAGQGECPESGGPLMILFVAAPPATLQSDQQADRKRHRQAAEHFIKIHASICQLCCTRSSTKSLA